MCLPAFFYFCHVCLPPLVSIEAIFSRSRLVTWHEEDVNNVVVGGRKRGGRERGREADCKYGGGETIGGEPRPAC